MYTKRLEIRTPPSPIAFQYLAAQARATEKDMEERKERVEREERKCVRVVAPLIPPMQTSRRK